MKKLVLGMVFVFATVIMVNANSNIIDEAERASDCDEVALATGYAAHIAGMNDEQIFFHMNVAYALCEGYTYEEIEDAGNM